MFRCTEHVLPYVYVCTSPQEWGNYRGEGGIHTSGVALVDGCRPPGLERCPARSS